MPEDFINKTLAALEVIRTNRPEYRKVFIKGVDDVDGGVFFRKSDKIKSLFDTTIQEVGL